DSAREFEVVVQALQDREVLAEARAVTSFRRDKRVVLPLSLFTCADLAALCADSSCRGPQCEACQADGSCAPVGVTDSSKLAPLSPSQQDEPGEDAGEDSGSAQEAGSRDASPGAGEAGLDGGGSDTDADTASDSGDAPDSSDENDASEVDGNPPDSSGSEDSSTTPETSTPLCSASSCDDLKACNGVETCNPSVGCQPGTPDNGTDDDGDGYTDAQGDCDDCVADVNPSAAEQGGNSVDEDCDGQTPSVVPSCDGALSINVTDSLDAARAIGLCKVGLGVRWGALAAGFMYPDGTGAPAATSYGVLSRFGVNNPREGTAMLALSSGAARAPGDPNYVAPRPGLNRNTTNSYVVGLPTTSRHCNSVNFAAPHDGTAVRITIKVPSNVNRMAFDFAFFTTDWINGICNTYADQFAVTMQGGGSSGTINLAPDELGDVMSVNSQFVAACTCPTAPNCTYGVYQRSCSLGAGLLSGTGFETGDAAGHSHAGTGWLTSTVPVTAGSMLTITAMIYDSGDGTYDSLALLDAFRFYRAPAGDAQTQPQVKRAQ
ncbi:MAG TPA: hypothetical protein VFZ61_15755, partial [Polyangiales bacterium]